MICEVQTLHGTSFAAAGMPFGPRPTRLWVSDDKPAPSKRLKKISHKTWAAIKNAAKRAPDRLTCREDLSLEGERQTEALDEAKARIEHLEGELADARDKLAEAAYEAKGLKEHATAIGRERDDLRESLEASQKKATEQAKQIKAQARQITKLKKQLADNE